MLNSVLSLGPFDVAVLGEGEEPLVELAAIMRAGGGPADIAGTAWRSGTALCIVLTARRSTARRSEMPFSKFPTRTCLTGSIGERLEQRYSSGATDDEGGARGPSC